MIELKPKVENDFVCPECKSPFPSVNDIVIQSAHAMADCTCTSCNFKFYQVFPVGHNVLDQLSVSKAVSGFYGTSSTEKWLMDSLVKAYTEQRNEPVNIERRVFRTCDDVVILNTLDYLYGHVLLKLYNAFHHLDHNKDLGLIVIIPRIFEWLIPPGCAEAWIVDLKLQELTRNHEAIGNFVSQQFSRFNSIYLSKAYSHPDLTTIDISRLTGVKPFDLSSFMGRKPVITFVLRQDRWWFPAVADYWFYRVCRKLKVMAFAERILCHRQNRLVKRTIRAIRKELSEAKFFIVGLGTCGDLAGFASDERRVKVDANVEMAWCKIYANSHVVVGVHGSNMLLPTALAAGCVEILPRERYGNMVQDLSVRYNDRRQLFFYRFSDQYSTPTSVAAKVVSMINHYEKFDTNMCRNVYST